MSALTRYFFHTVYYPASPWSVVAWWESRRPSYNLAVGAAGLVTLGALWAVRALPPWPALPILVAVYAVLANLCYTVGPLFDLLARRAGGPDWAPVGPTLFRYGFVFSLGLTLLPIPLALLGAAVRLVLAML